MCSRQRIGFTVKNVCSQVYPSEFLLFSELRGLMGKALSSCVRGLGFDPHKCHIFFLLSIYPPPPTTGSEANFFTDERRTPDDIQTTRVSRLTQLRMRVKNYSNANNKTYKNKQTSSLSMSLENDRNVLMESGLVSWSRLNLTLNVSNLLMNNLFSLDENCGGKNAYISLPT